MCYKTFEIVFNIENLEKKSVFLVSHIIAR